MPLMTTWNCISGRAGAWHADRPAHGYLERSMWVYTRRVRAADTLWRFYEL